MSRIIIDASVAVKWLLEEEYSKEADRFLEKYFSRYSPEHLLSECANALYKKVKLGEISILNATEGLSFLYNSETISLVPTAPLIQQAFQIAYEISHRFTIAFTSLWRNESPVS